MVQVVVRAAVVPSALLIVCMVVSSWSVRAGCCPLRLPRPMRRCGCALPSNSRRTWNGLLLPAQQSRPAHEIARDRRGVGAARELHGARELLVEQRQNARDAGLARGPE